MNDERAGWEPRRRLAIVGGGSSGLVCLKISLETLKGWEVVCFEKSDRCTGCWGNPYPGFVSTSTKYTTQFACFPVFDASIKPDGGSSREEFFRDGEFGRYLEQFADAFDLHRHIVLNQEVTQIRRSGSRAGWELTLAGSAMGDGQCERSQTTEHFTAVVICTGVAAVPKPVDSGIPKLTLTDLNGSAGLEHISNQRIVVIGGGETAVDVADRLARPGLGNRVYLSLHSGIRVSPRYHPIRGVPSDFLRNRLMLSVHEDIRNWIGQRFVELRIKYQELFERLFSSRRASQGVNPGQARIAEDSSSRDSVRKEWAFRLTKASKDELFNMFHNKSDDFLDAVGRGRITIIGPAIDDRYRVFREFDSEETVEVNPDWMVPAVGYESRLANLTSGEVKLTDFYLGCCHVEHDDLFLVGFARPIIGNIPTISEMQARYVCGLIGGSFGRDGSIKRRHRQDLARKRKRFPKLNLSATYPVEMIPYCDDLARRMGLSIGPGLLESPVSWWRSKLTPATTMHYFRQDPEVKDRFAAAPVYLPVTLIAFLVLMKPVDWAYRILGRIGSVVGTVFSTSSETGEVD